MIPQDNIWKANYWKLASRVGKEGGVISVLNKMLKKQKEINEITGEGPTIYHVLILPNPHNTIEEKYDGIIEGLSGYNDALYMNTINGKKSHHIIYKKISSSVSKTVYYIVRHALNYRQFPYL